ncbi:MAG: 50S ribosomal protein L4 [Chloroflexi bacterium]|nr:MAG: 50S ribosomal protein L4 [Anaerolineaceae bacterium 4572_32.1]RLD00371.1 MAG: 50S ribosomal protein L4 [Chloroflexota bacterium]
MLVPMYNTKGEKVGEVELRSDIFEVPVNVPLMHQALTFQLANARQGTHSTKSRGEVNRTKAKWYRQKGTGRARHGSRNANLFVGGGVAHGPKPRKYTKKMPRKMRRAALRSALSVKMAEAQIVVVDVLEMESPETKEMVRVLENLSLGQRVLILLPEQNEPAEKSARNIPRVKTLRANYLNIRDLFKYDHVLMPASALPVIESILGQER